MPSRKPRPLENTTGALRRTIVASSRGLASEAGAGMAEYTLILLLILVPLALAFPPVANAIANALQLVANQF